MKKKMQKSVVLKGYKDGYEIELKADAAFSQILIELTELFERLKKLGEGF